MHRDIKNKRTQGHDDDPKIAGSERLKLGLRLGWERRK